MFDRNFILHLTLIEDIGSGTIQRIIQRSELKTSDLYSFSCSDWMSNFGFTDLTAQKLSAGLQNKKILDYELDLIERHNVQWVTLEDSAYPQLLREIYLPPAVLYYLGEAFNDHCKSVAFVGARKADEYGYRAVNALIPDLVRAGYTIVSGGARGIDTAAHEATLNAGGKTVAVLGSGLLNPYPYSNKKLFTTIVDRGGLVVSSFPLTAQPLPGNFPARNRIIAGLSHGCVVVQAAKKSGALISAHYAMEQGREVFAVPGSFDDELSVGCNALIQQGAKLVVSSADIFEEFGDRIMQVDKQVIKDKAQQLCIESSVRSNPSILFEDKKLRASEEGMLSLSSARPECPERVYRRMAKETVENVENKNYSQAQQQILRVCKNATSLDDIMSATQLSFEDVQSELFDLQLDGKISQDFTGMWIALRI